MSNTFEGGPLVFLCVVKYKHMKFRKKFERHFSVTLMMMMMAMTMKEDTIKCPYKRRA